MAKPYDPLPDLAVTLANVYLTPAHELPPSTHAAFGRLMDKMGMGPGWGYPPGAGTLTEAVEVKLRAMLATGGDER